MTASAGERPALLRRREQRAQSGEAVGRGDAQRDELRKRLFDLRAQQSRPLDDLVVERRAVLAQMIDDCLRAAAQRNRQRRRRRRDTMPERRGAARKQRDRCRADGPRVPGSRCRRRQRQSRPDGAAGEAQIVEPRHVVGVETRGQELRLPRGDGRLETLQLADHHVERVGSFPALVRNEVLPAEEEPHEVLRADGFDLLPQALDRIAVDAREQRAVAPFLRRSRRRERAGDRDALRGQALRARSRLRRSARRSTRRALRR